MRTADPGLIQLLGSRRFLLADLYQFTLENGTILQYTSFDTDVGAYHSGLGWERTQAKWQVGLMVDTMDVVMQAKPTDFMPDGVTPIIESVAAGDWDGAAVQVSRQFMPIQGDTLTGGAVVIFTGWIGDITEVGRIHAKFQLQSKTALLNIGLPRALFGPSCRHVLYDAGCTLNRGSFTTTGTVGGGSTAGVIQTGGGAPAAVIPGPTLAPTLSHSSADNVNLPFPTTYYVTQTYLTAYGETLPGPEGSITLTNFDQLVHVSSPASVAGATGWNAYIGLGPGDEQLQNQAPLSLGSSYTSSTGGIYLSGQTTPTTQSQGWYALGVITFTSGPNSGRRRVIESSSGGALTLRVPLPVIPNPGDTFSISLGCDHTMAQCQQKFNNLIHFGGFPYIPPPEQAGA